LAGKSELSAGDALVLRHLHGKARQRQRYLLGLPLLALGIWGIWALLRRRSSLAIGSN
jgi:zinc/manganese transport system permease protein